MLPDFLAPEQTVSSNGDGPIVDVKGQLIELTLGITSVLEQQSLDVSIHDGAGKLLAAFPQKFYKGMSSLMLDLNKTPDVAQLQAKWKVNRWGHWKTPAEFTFYVFAKPVEP